LNFAASLRPAMRPGHWFCHVLVTAGEFARVGTY
jgi:hypothetical protein